MKVVNGYTLLEGQSHDELASKVKALIFQGWQPFGRPFAIPFSGLSIFEAYFYQAMVTYEQ